MGRSLILLDYDDTLFPTTFVTPLYLHSKKNGISFDLYKELYSFFCIIRTVLQRWIQLENTDIKLITNSMGGWINKSMVTFLPDLYISSLLHMIEFIIPKEMKNIDFTRYSNPKDYIFEHLVHSGVYDTIYSFNDSVEESTTLVTFATGAGITCSGFVFKWRPTLQELTQQWETIRDMAPELFCAGSGRVQYIPTH